jgi:hypothetical protein
MDFFCEFLFLLALLCVRMRIADFAPPELLIGHYTLSTVALWVRKNSICLSHCSKYLCLFVTSFIFHSLVLFWRLSDHGLQIVHAKMKYGLRFETLQISYRVS